MVDVIARVRFSREALDLMQKMGHDAIERAIYATMARLKELATKYTPVRTGRLLSTFGVARTSENMITMVWHGRDPISGFAYSEVADIGRAGGVIIKPKRPDGWLKFWWERMGIPMKIKKVVQGAMKGAYFSEAMKFEARMILVEELKKEFGQVSAVGVLGSGGGTNWV